MACIERRHPACTSPPLRSHARSASRRSACRSALTANHPPALALNRDSSLPASKRVRRRPIASTQAAPHASRPAAEPSPTSRHLVPSASNETLGTSTLPVTTVPLNRQEVSVLTTGCSPV